jgi:C-terminal processing protease CtpA/Prc
VVSRIDGRSTGELDQDGPWSKLEGPVGTKLELDVRSSGIDRRVMLSLRDIL